MRTNRATCPVNLAVMPVPEIDVDELADLRDSGVPLIDVRQPDEYEAGHVPGAVLIPLAEVPERIEEVPTDGAVYIICETGSRSARAAEYLQRNGIDAVNVVGGTSAWLAADLPVTTGSELG